MSKNITAVLGLNALEVAPGTIAGNFRVSLLDAGTDNVHQVIDTPDLVISFENVPEGAYRVSAIRMDANGLFLGTDAVSEPFTITADDAPAKVTIDVPVAVTVTVA